MPKNPDWISYAPVTVFVKYFNIFYINFFQTYQRFFEIINIFCLELNSCSDLNCLNNIFEQFDKMEHLEFDLRLSFQFEELFQKGLLEQLAEKIEISKISKIFTKLFENMTHLSYLFQKYFPFYDSKNAPKLGELTRWKIRRNLSENKIIISNSEIPKHIIQILKYERKV